MSMNEDEKRAVVARLERYVRLKGSQKKASNSLDGVSSATINKMLRGTWDDIADPMWRNLANQLGGSTERTWQIAPTKAYRKMGFLLGEAQRNSLTLGIVGSAGTGKSEAVRQYAETHSNVYHLACAEFWRKKVFIQQLVKSLGCGAQGGTVEELMDVAVSTLSKQDHPLIVLDEADKLSDPVLYFFITLYNLLEGRCGLVLQSTSYLEKRIQRGLTLGKRGYEEIYSRLGRHFIRLDSIDDEDVALVCSLNGIENVSTIRQIAKESDYDLRMVRRAVWATLMSNE